MNWKTTTYPFLEVNVFRDASTFSTTVHRKVTFSGVYTHFGSFMPVTYKRGLVSTLLYRAYMINSTFFSLHTEIQNLKKIFSKNGYPSKFVDRCVSTFLNKLYEKKVTVDTVPKMDLMIVLPFLGTASWQIKNELIKTFKKNVPFCNLKIVFKSGKRLSSFFTFKDKLPKSLMSGVLYKYTCAKCNLSYVGCTKRFWETRLQEHTHVSGLTGKSLSGCQMFAPKQHARACCHVKVTRDDFQIIGHEKDRNLLLLKESITINTSRPH